MAALLLALWLGSAPSVAAGERSGFPVQVYIEPQARHAAFADHPGEALSESTLATLRQGFLDWVSVVLAAPSKGSAEQVLVILRKQVAESQAGLLLGAGLFTFVKNRAQAQLVVEIVHQPPLAAAAGLVETVIGRYRRSGLIELVLLRSGAPSDQFALRTALMHAVGHALGFAHSDAGQCNLMSSERHLCHVPFPAECREEAVDTRCVAVAVAPLRVLDRAVRTGRTVAEFPGSSER
ncbi:hypothetical protein [Gloeobacter violaceus]|uniref:hypothetical protein n=1 Tax=Gloeobacter violaceus TaxID=33072 RepID=UPI0013E89E34|nr:hypothetical protein [Gloeobacter violaceus]